MRKPHRAGAMSSAKQRQPANHESTHMYHMYMAVYISIHVSKHIVPNRGTPSPKKKQLYDWTHLRQAAKTHGHIQAELAPNSPTKPSSFEIRDPGMSNKETLRSKL